MNQNFKPSKTSINYSGTMETRDHSKNGANLKSQMSKKNLKNLK